MNITTVIGNLAADPELRTLNNGGKVANLRIGANRKVKDQEFTDWYTVTAWGENATTAGSLKKGDRVVVVGRFQTRKWQDKSGADRYSTELVADTYDGVVARAPIPSRKGKQEREPGEDIDDEIPW